jgi:hypothetical protein
VSERKSKTKFKQFCEENNLRYKINECGEPISPSRVRKHSEDHLWWTGVDNGMIGVSVVRPTETTYNKIKRKLLSLGCILSQEGDTEGNFFVSEKKVMKVAKLLHTQKRKGSSERSRRMKEFWAQRKKEVA